MARVKIQVERGKGLTQTVVIDTSATEGATLGSNVFLNGAVATPAAVLAWLGGSATGAALRNGYGILISGTNPQTVNVNRAAAFDWQGQHSWEKPLWGPNGTAALPAFTFGSDPNTGLYRVGADNPGITAGGTLRWDITSVRSQQNVPAYVVMTVPDNTVQPLLRLDATNASASDADRFEISAPVTSGSSATGLRMGMWDVPIGLSARGFRWELTQTGSSAPQLSFFTHHNSDAGNELLRFLGDSTYIQVMPSQSYGFALNGRAISNLAVPFFTPVTSGVQIAFDIFPKGAPGNFTSNTGVAWMDVCSTDVAADGTNYECLRMGKLASGNAHIGGAAGGTGTVRNLQLQMNGGQVLFPDGAVGTPSHAYTSDTNTGMYWVSADTWDVVTGGVSRFRFGAAGQLGIGGATYGTSGHAFKSGGSGGAPTWGVLAEVGGGTNFSTYTTGDLLYASASNTLAKLGIGAAGDVLRVSGGAPAWQAPANLGANPSASFGVNLAGANGSASTFLRSDAVLKLDQSIAPTWTEEHTFLRNVNARGRIVLQNPNAGALAAAQMALTNGTNGFGMAVTGTGFSGPWLPGMDSGPAAALYTSTITQLALGTNDQARVLIDGNGAYVRLLPTVLTVDGFATFGGDWLSSQATSASRIYAGTQGGHPSALFTHSGGGVDSKFWQHIFVPTQALYRLVNDAFSAAANYLAVTRAATSVAAMEYGNATDNPPHTFYGQLVPNGQSLSTGASVPSIGANKPGSAVALTPATWWGIVVNGTQYYIPLWQ